MTRPLIICYASTLDWPKTKGQNSVENKFVDGLGKCLKAEGYRNWFIF